MSLTEYVCRFSILYLMFIFQYLILINGVQLNKQTLVAYVCATYSAQSSRRFLKLFSKLATTTVLERLLQIFTTPSSWLKKRDRAFVRGSYPLLSWTGESGDCGGCIVTLVQGCIGGYTRVYAVQGGICVSKLFHVKTGQSWTRTVNLCHVSETWVLRCIQIQQSARVCVIYSLVTIATSPIALSY